MRIEIGITGRNPGWRLLLEQEGVPHSAVEEPDGLQGFSAVVAGDDCPASMIGPLKSYLRQGGGVLSSGVMFEKLSGIPCSRRFISWLAPENGSQFSDSGLTDIFLHGTVPGGPNTVPDQSGRRTILNREWAGGYIIVLPFDPASVVLDQRTMTKSFYAERSRLPYERVSSVTKSGVRFLVRKGLEILHHARGLPYGHLWYYPEDRQSVAALRVDTDFAGQSDLEELLSVSRQVRKPFTWIVDVQSQEKHLPLFRELGDHDMGLHCYRHARFRNKREALRDLSRGMDLLRRNNFVIRTCALPYGQWSVGLGEALEELGVDFSSEFSYDADNVPSAPYLGTRFSRVVQIPVHPISVGSLSRQGCSEKEMLMYFNAVIMRRIGLREPVILYHHPKNHHPRVVESFFTHLAESAAGWMTIPQFGDWWKARNLTGLSIECSESSFRIRSRQPLGTRTVHLTRGDGTEGYVSGEGDHEPQKIQWRDRARVPELPPDIRRIRKFNPWIPIQRMEDFMLGIGR